MTASTDDTGSGSHPLASGRAAVFRVDDVDYRWDAVFAHARRRSAWSALEAQAREAQACLRMLADEGLTPAVEEERAAARAFRYERRLYAAQDLEAWLAERGLSVAEWRDYVRGVVLRRRHAADLAAIVARCPPTEEELRRALAAWGVCSGAFTSWAQELAARAAAAHALWQDGGAGEQPPGPDRLDHVDALYERFAETRATPERLRATLRQRYLDWLRIDGEQAAFRSVDAAREALLCVRDDGSSFAQAARMAGTQAHPSSFLLEEVDEGARHDLLRAGEGDLVGPLQREGGWTLLHVHRKTAPDAEAPDVRARAVADVVARAVAREVDDRVRWLTPL